MFESNFEDITSIIHSLLQSENYVARRQSLKILRDIMSNEGEFLSKYVAVGDHLKIHMNLLRDKSKSIAYESFMIFHVRV
jgi:calcium binding protein 39